MDTNIGYVRTRLTIHIAQPRRLDQVLIVTILLDLGSKTASQR
jgi:hypothetical protein